MPTLLTLNPLHKSTHFALLNHINTTFKVQLCLWQTRVEELFEMAYKWMWVSHNVAFKQACCELMYHLPQGGLHLHNSWCHTNRAWDWWHFAFPAYGRLFTFTKYSIHSQGTRRGSWFMCSGWWVWPSSHSDRFSVVLASVRTITTVYLIWGRRLDVTGPDLSHFTHSANLISCTAQLNKHSKLCLNCKTRQCWSDMNQDSVNTLLKFCLKTF